MKATVVITTKNRRDELRVALASCIIQTANPEILVIDDGSDDGTSEMVKAEFHQVRLITKDCSEGYIARRNLGAELATGDVVFSIDDDAEFSSPYVIEQTLVDLVEPSIAAVAIPLIEPKYDNQRLQFPPDQVHIWITDTFKGTAYAIRKSSFQKVGGFREDLIHQGEEMDLCIRLLEQSQYVRLGSSDHIIHYESPKRDLRRMHYYGRRNDLLFAMRNAPFSRLLVHLVGTTLNGLRASIGVKQASAMYKGTLYGWIDCLKLRETRAPVSIQTYKLFRSLRREARRIDEIQQCA